MGASQRAAIVLLLTLFLAQASQADGVLHDLGACREIADSAKRLSCYDATAKRHARPTFSGKFSQTTNKFTISRPHLIRYQSDGVIFVLYLKDEKGRTLQNLHMGGGGEDSYLIEVPGTYSLEVSGSRSWRIWLEPQ